ncbi:MAG: nucleotidyltransferase domain-containing protein [Lachnospiraceae bacterium]|nr:nucleotidyltransferase domain-containing protein [Lachnospiraceae bacterium]
MNNLKSFREIEIDKDRTFYVLKPAFNHVQNINKIHPLKQEKVYSLVNSLEELDFLKRVWIFGSSTNNCCNIRSDIDVLVELTNPDYFTNDDIICKIQKAFYKSLGSNFDVVYLNNLDISKQFFINVMKTRRLVYERLD